MSEAHTLKTAGAKRKYLNLIFGLWHNHHSHGLQRASCWLSLFSPPKDGKIPSFRYFFNPIKDLTQESALHVMWDYCWLKRHDVAFFLVRCAWGGSLQHISIKGFLQTGQVDWRVVIVTDMSYSNSTDKNISSLLYLAKSTDWPWKASTNVWFHTGGRCRLSCYFL